jgi:prevent-host-death family protein
MEINVKEARNKISALLDITQKGGEVLISRRGKKDGPLSRTVIDSRNAERY